MVHTPEKGEHKRYLQEKNCRLPFGVNIIYHKVKSLLRIWASINMWCYVQRYSPKTTSKHTFSWWERNQAPKGRGGLLGVFAFQIHPTSNKSIMIPAYTRRLNAWQIKAFPEKQESNKWHQKQPSLFFYLQAGCGTVKAEAQWACCCTAVCVPSCAGGSKGLEAKHQWCGLWLHLVQMKEGEKVWTNSLSHRLTSTTSQSCNSNQSQTCQPDSTCTFVACVGLVKINNIGIIFLTF